MNKFFSSLVLGFCFFSLTTQAENRKFIGLAYDPDGKSLLYSEEHSYKNDYQHEVIYKEADGQVFAKKTVDYRRSFIAPAFQQTNSRNGEYIETRYNNDDTLEVIYRENKDQQQANENIDVNESLVIDAGFDHFIRDHWDELIEGKSKVINYLLPSHQQSIDLRIESIDCSSVLLNGDDPNTINCWRVATDSWVFRILSAPLLLAYDKSTRHLLTFAGRSNICDSKGDYQDVVIRYQYTYIQEEKSYVKN